MYEPCLSSTRYTMQQDTPRGRYTSVLVDLLMEERQADYLEELSDLRRETAQQRQL